MIKKLLLSIILLFSIVSPFGVAMAQEEATFIIPIGYMPSSLQPSTSSDDYTTMIRPIYEQLYAEKPDGGLDYYLADEVEVSEDRTKYTIHINKDANWSDGTPITVDDVLFSIGYANHSGGGSSSYSKIDDQEVEFNSIDNKTLEIQLPKPYATYLMSLSRLIPMPAHKFENDPANLEDTTYFSSADIVTSGAYTVDSINEDNIIYKVREDYYRGEPQVKTIVLKLIGSGSSRNVALENGEISYMRVTTANELEKYSNDENYNIASVPEGRINYLQINPYSSNNFSEKEREAIFLALNAEEIVQIAYGDERLAKPANSILTPEMTLYNPENEFYEQNIEKAKQLAEETGLTGKTLTYIFNKDRANMEQIATVVQQQLAQIGVNVIVEGLDSPTFFPRFFAKLYDSGQEGSWDLGTNGQDSMRGSSLTSIYSNINNSKDAWGYSPETKQLAIDVNQAETEEEAMELAKELQQAQLKEFWGYPLTYTNYVMVSQKNVTGLDQQTVIPEIIDWLPIEVK